MAKDKRRSHSHRSPSPPPQKPRTEKLPNFPSYLTVPNLHPKVKLICEIISTTPSSAVENLLEDTGLRITQPDVETVLKFSYSFPSQAVKFFRWSGHKLQHQHSPYSWNLVVDLLGKNGFFDAMWDAVQSMKKEGKVGDVRGAELIWDAMVGKVGLMPDTQMYNSMIDLYCYKNNSDMAKKMLDEMIYTGAFPDLQSYNVIFHSFIKNRRLKEASVLFNEMVKNECYPSKANCIAAVKLFIDIGDPYVAIKVWKFMIENYDSDLEDSGNILVVGLLDVRMLPEAVKYAGGMIEKGIKVTSATLTRLKQSLGRANKIKVYEELLRKWKSY
ncbi:hypothetical protein CCACVL1_27204 [Corchorus capsularis]|uniref:Pentatricopeptide repeat-containing protein n=1 Tax=Corchorus capsularis TaxID=210143 RepID=A0A1R3GBS4_COCAP|nr:hypothetical protein CCACVL1_27204 [Corchorus capsularis]